MKKIKSLLLLAFFLFAFQTVKCQITNGTGTASDPYQIWTANDLVQFKNEINSGDTKLGKYYSIMADIDMSSITDWSTGDSFFAGKLNGNYHTLSNFTGKTGLLYIIDPVGEICNIILKNAFIYNEVPRCMGGIASDNRGKIYNCHAEVTIKLGPLVQLAQAHGGIAGSNSNLIENCFSNFTMLSLYDRVGGISSGGDNGIVRNCYATGSLKMPGFTYIGGIVGQLNPNSRVESCVNLMDTIIGDNSYYHNGVNRIFGYEGGKGTNNYSIESTLLNGATVSGASNNPNGGNITLAQAQSQSFYESIGWDFVNIWKMSNSLGIYKGYPILKGMKDEFAFTKLYVNQANQNSSVKNGVSWATAFTKLEDALTFAASYPGMMEEIWVAQGTYQPAANSFYTMENKLGIYGGFIGTETSKTNRNWETNQTILQGNNSSVIRNQFSEENPLDSTAILDGFTIQDGIAMSDEIYSGGGIYNENASPIIQNCTIEYCAALSGGGIFNLFSNPKIRNTVIQNNTAIVDGAGVENAESSPEYTYVSILSNTTEDGEGGGMYNSGGSPLFTNVKIIGNRANTGGGIYNMGADVNMTNIQLSGNVANLGGGLYNTDRSTTALVNATISGNYAGTGGGVYNTSTKATIPAKITIKNSIMWGNRSTTTPVANVYNLPSRTLNSIGVEYSLLEGCNGSNFWSSNRIANSGNNMDVSPLFVNYRYAANATSPITTGNYRLTLSSTAINACNNSYNQSTTDLDNNTRVVQSVIDMGAFEFQFTKSSLVAENETLQEGNTEEINNLVSSIKVYPNPVTANNKVTVELEIASGEYTGIVLEVFNTLGVKLNQYNVTEKATEIRMPNAKGHYFIKVTYKDGSMTLKRIAVL